MRGVALLVVLCCISLRATDAKKVGYRPTELKLMFPKDESNHKHYFDEDHERFDPMHEPILHFGGRHYEDVHKEMDTSGDGLVRAELKNTGRGSESLRQITRPRHRDAPQEPCSHRRPTGATVQLTRARSIDWAVLSIPGADRGARAQKAAHGAVPT